MSTTTPNFGWQVPTSTDYVKDGAVAIETLGDAIDASLADLKGGTTGQVLSKATNTDMDFAWVTPDDADAIQNTIIDAKGDLIVGSAADTPARLAVGSNGQVLTADSTTATGLKWAIPAAGGMTLLSTTTLSGASTDVTSIPGTYNSLQIVIIKPTTGSAFHTRFRLNNSTNANYWTQYTSTASTSIANITADTTFYTAASANYDDGTAVTIIQIYNYADSGSPKTANLLSVFANGGVNRVERQSLGWFDNTAVTSIRFYPNSGSFTGGTVYTYGVK